MTSIAHPRRIGHEVAKIALVVLMLGILASVPMKDNLVRWLLKSDILPRLMKSGLIGAKTLGLLAKLSASKPNSGQVGGAR